MFGIEQRVVQLTPKEGLGPWEGEGDDYFRLVLRATGAAQQAFRRAEERQLIDVLILSRAQHPVCSSTDKIKMKHRRQDRDGVWCISQTKFVHNTIAPIS